MKAVATASVAIGDQDLGDQDLERGEARTGVVSSFVEDVGRWSMSSARTSRRYGRTGERSGEPKRGNRGFSRRGERGDDPICDGAADEGRRDRVGRHR
jgi:hypothetical protein